MPHVKDLLPQTSPTSSAPQTSIPGMEEGGKKSSKVLPRDVRQRIEVIFKTFTKHYGAQRMAAFWGSNGQSVDEAKQSAEDLKRYWAHKLRNTSHREVIYALDNLPNPFPPTPDEFIEVAKRMPMPYVPQIGYVESDEEREERKATGRERFAALKAKFPFLCHPHPEQEGEPA